MPFNKKIHALQHRVFDTLLLIMYILYAVIISLFIGLTAGYLPAKSAAQMDPIEALRAD